MALVRITPDTIIATLFDFHNKAHFFHLQTTSFEQHKFLDTLYKELVEMKDSIGEYLLGVQAPRRFGIITLSQLEPYSEQNVQKLIEEGIFFSKDLCKYAETNCLDGLIDFSSKLNQLFVSAKLFSTYR